MSVVKLFLLLSLAYTIAMVFSAIHVMYNWRVKDMEGFETLKDVKDKGMKVESYKKTVAFFPLYNIIAFGGISMVCFRGLPPLQLLQIGLMWLALGFVADVIGWILIPRPWQQTWRELFIDHQPGITLAYLAIVLSPFPALLVS